MRTLVFGAWPHSRSRLARFTLGPRPRSVGDNTMGCASSEPVYPDAVSKTPPRPPPEKEISKFKAPPEELIAELLSTGKVVPDEVAGPQDFTMLHVSQERHRDQSGPQTGHRGCEVHEVGIREEEPCKIEQLHELGRD